MMPKLKKILFVMYLLFPGLVFAEWNLVVTNVDQTLHYYVDRDSVEKKGNYLRAWILTDYSKTNEYGHGSNKSLYEFDCDGRVRMLVFAPYEGRMGQGKAFNQVSAEPKWYFSTPGDIHSFLLKYVCQPRWN